MAHKNCDGCARGLPIDKNGCHPEPKGGMGQGCTAYRYNPEDYFNRAIEGVESASIKKWANSEHNRPIFLKLAKNAMDSGMEVARFTAYIVCQAIGL